MHSFVEDRLGLAYRAKQKKYNDHKCSRTTHNGTPEDTSRRGDGGIFGLLCYMAGGIVSDQNTGGSQIRQTPIPASRGARAVVRAHKCFFGRAEAQRVGDTDGQPNDVEYEIEDDKSGRDVKDIAEVSR
jgi:hypothetical protein